MMSDGQPIQPLHIDPDGVIRFRANAIVRRLLDHAQSLPPPLRLGLTELALESFADADREQFAQLIGYSLSGFGELGYVRDETYNRAATAAEPLKGDPT